MIEKKAGIGFIENRKNGKIYILYSLSNIIEVIRCRFSALNNLSSNNEELIRDYVSSASSFTSFYQLYDDPYKMRIEYEKYLEVFSDCVYNINNVKLKKSSIVNIKTNKETKNPESKEKNKESKEKKKRELSLKTKNRIALRKFIKYREDLKQLKRDVREENNIEPEFLSEDIMEILNLNISSVGVNV